VQRVHCHEAVQQATRLFSVLDQHTPLKYHQVAWENRIFAAGPFLSFHILYGEYDLGKVEKVPNLFYVCTRFGHLYFFPFFPRCSYLVLAGTEDTFGFRGVPSDLSWKSVFVGWFRAVLILGMGLGCLTALCILPYYYSNSKPVPSPVLILSWLLPPVCALCYWLTIRLTYASRERAVQLGAQLGLAPMVVEQFFDDKELSAAVPLAIDLSVDEVEHPNPFEPPL
jgi:hypothetical protein